VVERQASQREQAYFVVSGGAPSAGCVLRQVFEVTMCELVVDVYVRIKESLILFYYQEAASE